MVNKNFSERLNKALDDIDLPQHFNERITAFAKLIKTPRFKAEAILNGSIPQDSMLMNKLCEELDVQMDWLLGNEQPKNPRP